MVAMITIIQIEVNELLTHTFAGCWHLNWQINTDIKLHYYRAKAASVKAITAVHFFINHNSRY